MEKVSVIIPIYNVEKYLPKCLDSIVGQTYKNLEIICVNDGSPDNSIDILNSYAAKDSRIVILNKENGGVSSSRNAGIRIATGEYIVFVDSDDWLDTDTIQSAVSSMEKDNVEMVFWGYVREFSGYSDEKKIFSSDKIFNKEETHNIIQRRMIGLVDEELRNPENADALVPVWGKLFRTEIIRQNKLEFIDLKLIGTSEDAFFNLEYFMFINSCKFINKPYYHYRKDNESSLTTVNKPRLFEQWLVLYKKMSEYIRNNDCPQGFTSALYNRICLNMIGLGINEFYRKTSFSEHKKEIKRTLSSPLFRKAYSHLTLKYFPIHWKLFFLCCKKNFAFGACAVLKAISIILKSRN